MSTVYRVRSDTTSESPNAAYGKVLRAYREQCGIGVRELARHASRTKPITHSYISQMETGRRPVSRELLQRLLTAVTELHQEKSTAA